ncbi:membrane protein [Anopheles sinensis]|uniref:Membrane protein n=1 Tax=Anopheles sinensis TaxID=74873 RepID=A0A084WUW2_ANOSI|nr:membrane protein [Anopheles sinensis]
MEEIIANLVHSFGASDVRLHSGGFRSSGPKSLPGSGTGTSGTDGVSQVCWLELNAFPIRPAAGLQQTGSRRCRFVA